MRARDVVKLRAGVVVVVQLRELGRPLPEELATFVQYNADRQTWRPGGRGFPVAVKTRHQSLWITTAAVRRVASDADRENLAPPVVVAVGGAR